MVRVITGKFKGRNLEVAEGTKPLTDRIKTSIFDLVRDFITPETFVLDLFSGSGAFAIEALSRGAGKAVMVDNGDKAHLVITNNIEQIGVNSSCENRKQDAFKFLESETRQFGLIMLDPPFPFTVERKAKLFNLSLNLLKADGLLIFRYPTHEDYNFKQREDVDETYQQKYGISTVSFCRKKFIISEKISAKTLAYMLK